MSTAPEIAIGTTKRRQLRLGPFGRYVCMRVIWGIAVVFAVALTVFVVTRLESNPAQQILGVGASRADVEALNRQLGVSDPILTQLWHYLQSVVTFSFGHSYVQDASVGTLISKSLPNTVLLVGVAVVVAGLAGITLGIFAARRPGSVVDRALASSSLVALSMPQFWLGTMLILVFAVELRWFPTSGMGGVSHLVLPAVTMGLPSMGRIAQITRTTMIDELATQHITVARSKELGERAIILRHALRNTMIAIITVWSWELTYALAGYSVVVETVFAWPGIGQLSIQAIQREDLPLVQGIVMVVAVVVVVVNLVTDLLYVAIDPRIDL